MMKVNATRLLTVFWTLTVATAFVSQRYICPTANAPTASLHQAKSVYQSADPTKLIKLTAYLRNPKPAAKEQTKEMIQVENLSELLEKALTSFDSEPAKKIIETITAMRKTGNGQEEITQTLDNLLADGPDKKLPFWARVRFLSRVSKRARLATLRRTLDLATPPPTIEDETEDTAEEQQRRRRRALVSLLQTLASPTDEPESSMPAIASILKKAKREQKAKSTADMRSRLPTDLETPKYEVIAERTRYEIRRYDSFSVCSVSMKAPGSVGAFKTDSTVSDPKAGGATAFGALAGYLFGKNQEATSMKMTTPVLSRGEADAKTMSFVMPSEFWKADGLSMAPKPLEGSRVVLERVEGDERAVVMFGGYASKKEVENKKTLLLDKLQNDNDWMPANDDPPVLAQYNDPFTPPWKRLNEVSVAVKSRS
mmetsp:Transcript_19354/g.36542  ORF Transcript_19354/g.36542 Transcript_19354/m.36542 type:complete len:426 (-) Transcript_19354:260-1537(-)